MKTIFRLLCGLMAIALTTACSHEELLQTEPMQKPAEGKMVSVKAYTPSEQPASRLAFDDQGTEGLKLSWSEGDAFTAVVGNSKVTFTYDANTKEFSGILPDGATLTDGVNAYYPAYTDEYVKDFSTQTGALNSATTYMEGAYDATAQAFRFTHSTAILKVAFSGLPQDAEIESISIVGAGGDITISNPNATINKDAVYINLPALAKDSKLVFYVETTAGLYTATKTVAAEEGIKVGVYYNTTVALQEACLLPAGNEFNAAITAVEGYESATSLVFKANVAGDTPATRSGSNYTIALAGNVLTISTPLSEFVFNADCSGMFSYLTNIQSIDFGNCVNTANVTNMDDMFSGCQKLTSLDLSSFNTANVTSMVYMFNSCSSLTSLDLSSFNTANVIFMYNMFNNCSSLTSLDLSSFNTAKVESMNYMFADCHKLTSLDLSSFDFSQVTNFENMFNNLGNSAENQPIPIYVTAAGYDILKDKNTDIIDNTQYAVPGHLPAGSTFNEAVKNFLNNNPSLTKIKFIANSNNTNKDNRIGTSEPYMVAGSDNTLEIHTAAAEFVFNADCSHMFDGLSTITAISFNDCVNTANVTNMAAMFYECSALTSLDLSSFNTSNVEAMNNIFYGCSMLTSLDVSNFNTTKVTTMASMFDGCSKLTSLDLRNFNTSKVTDMSYMFNNCSSLTSLDLRNFNTSKVTTMAYMFCYCSNIAELKLINFDFRNVTDFDDMFYDLARNDAQTVPVYVYVTQDSYNILKDKDTYINSNYAWFVNENGFKYED